MGEITSIVPEGIPLAVAMPQWDVTVPFVRLGNDGPMFVAIHPMCDQLQVKFDNQMEKIIKDDRFNQVGTTIMKILVPTNGGRQPMWCLRKAEAAVWVSEISPKRVKESARDHLMDIQQAIKDFADRILFGDRSNVLTVHRRAPLGGDVDVGPCPRCNTPLQVLFTSEGIFVKIADA